MTTRQGNARGLLAIIILASIILLIIMFLIQSDSGNSKQESGPPLESSGQAAIRIGNTDFIFNINEVKTVRPDLFKPGRFSVFDILVHLSEEGKINLAYHFDATMNTHVIDSMNQEPYWWYQAFYDGGWREDNVFRMDHYPWKEKTTLRFFEEDSSHLEDVYLTFREEVEKRTRNNGKIIIPKVIIKGKSFEKEFSNIEVNAHNMRNDTFQNDVITALDVIMSLGDQGKINYELMWYDSIGTARIVNSYWVEAIDADKGQGRCGFVYEEGSVRFNRFSGNHIHIPADYRIINSPDYVEFFWICL